MRLKIAVFIWLLISFYSIATKEIGDSTAIYADMIINTAEKYHFQPRSLNDSFAILMFDNLIRGLDPYSILFTDEIITELRNKSLALDNNIKDKDTTILSIVKTIYKEQLNKSDSLLNLIEKEGVEFNTADTIWFGKEVIPVKEKLQRHKWEKLVKYLILYSYISLEDSSESTLNLNDSLTEQFLKEVISRERCRIESKFNTPGGTAEIVNKTYLKAIATTFDPHSDFITYEEMRQREASLSAESGSFGLDIKINEIGEVEVDGLVPGGPAWYSNKIDVGDVILSIEKSDGSKIDLNCISGESLSDFLTTVYNGKARFHIRKKNGEIVFVILKKIVLDVEKNQVLSFIIKGKEKIGYIYLPSFYTDYGSNDHYNGCSNVIAKELVKLKDESIRGLIFDIRSNGGGVMEEAIRIAGSFVDKGALCITKTGKGKPVTSKDRALGTIYDGPLVLLVSSASASASELLAATLQDYNRAIIVGSETFGKSSIQTILPIDASKVDSLKYYEGYPPAYLALTIGGFYRISGESHQYFGIKPDIYLPELFENLNPRESSIEGALKFNKIEKKVYAYPLNPIELKELNSKSLRRQRDSKAFKFINKKKSTIAKVDRRIAVPLKYESFREHINRFDELEDSLKLYVDTLNIFPTNFSENQSEKIYLKYEEDKEKELLQDIKHDTYIIEAYNIITDLIELNTQEKKDE